MALDEQIRTVDRVVKDCDTTRKQLDVLVRKLDDLYDEVKHFREFLTYEKHRRDPSGSNYKAQGMVSIDQIAETLCTLTVQLSKEWDEKLEVIRTTQLQQSQHPS